jgi:hypothetical protein
MSLTDAQIARLALGGFRGRVNVNADDVDELVIYVGTGYDFLEEQHNYDPRQYAITSSAVAVQHWAMMRFCEVRPDLLELASFYRGLFRQSQLDWAGEAATQFNIHHNEYPENRTRVSWNNDDPLNQSQNIFGVDPNRLGT